MKRRLVEAAGSSTRAPHRQRSHTERCHLRTSCSPSVDEHARRSCGAGVWWLQDTATSPSRPDAAQVFHFDGRDVDEEQRFNFARWRANSFQAPSAQLESAGPMHATEAGVGREAQGWRLGRGGWDMGTALPTKRAVGLAVRDTARFLVASGHLPDCHGPRGSDASPSGVEQASFCASAQVARVAALSSALDAGAIPAAKALRSTCPKSAQAAQRILMSIADDARVVLPALALCCAIRDWDADACQEITQGLQVAWTCASDAVSAASIAVLAAQWALINADASLLGTLGPTPALETAPPSAACGGALSPTDNALCLAWVVLARTSTDAARSLLAEVRNLPRRAPRIRAAVDSRDSEPLTAARKRLLRALQLAEARWQGIRGAGDETAHDSCRGPRATPDLPPLKALARSVFTRCRCGQPTASALEARLAGEAWSMGVASTGVADGSNPWDWTEGVTERHWRLCPADSRLGACRADARARPAEGGTARDGVPVRPRKRPRGVGHEAKDALRRLADCWNVRSPSKLPRAEDTFTRTGIADQGRAVDLLRAAVAEGDGDGELVYLARRVLRAASSAHVELPPPAMRTLRAVACEPSSRAPPAMHGMGQGRVPKEQAPASVASRVEAQSHMRADAPHSAGPVGDEVVLRTLGGMLEESGSLGRALASAGPVALSDVRAVLQRCMVRTDFPGEGGTGEQLRAGTVNSPYRKDPGEVPGDPGLPSKDELLRDILMNLEPNYKVGLFGASVSDEEDGSDAGGSSDGGEFLLKPGM